MEIWQPLAGVGDASSKGTDDTPEKDNWRRQLWNCGTETYMILLTIVISINSIKRKEKYNWRRQKGWDAKQVEGFIFFLNSSRNALSVLIGGMKMDFCIVIEWDRWVFYVSYFFNKIWSVITSWVLWLEWECIKIWEVCGKQRYKSFILRMGTWT